MPSNAIVMPINALVMRNFIAYYNTQFSQVMPSNAPNLYTTNALSGLSLVFNG